MNRIDKRILIIFALIIATIILLILGLNRRDNQIGTSQEFSDPNGPAVMNDSEELYRLVNNDDYYTETRKGLAYFARQTIEKYKSGELIDVVFTVKEESIAENGVFSFSGNFDGSRDLILIDAYPKNYGKIYLSITNEKTNKNIDAKLPINSVANQYIGELPKDGGDFRIDYSPDEGFIIVLYEKDPSLNETAEKMLLEGLGMNDINEIEVNYIISQF